MNYAVLEVQSVYNSEQIFEVFQLELSRHVVIECAAGDESARESNNPVNYLPRARLLHDQPVKWDDVRMSDPHPAIHLVPLAPDIGSMDGPFEHGLLARGRPSLDIVAHTVHPPAESSDLAQFLGTHDLAGSAELRGDLIAPRVHGHRCLVVIRVRVESDDPPVDGGFDDDDIGTVSATNVIDAAREDL